MAPFSTAANTFQGQQFSVWPRGRCVLGSDGHCQPLSPSSLGCHGLAYGFTTAISCSRITTGAHFPSDVFLGAALGYTLRDMTCYSPLRNERDQCLLFRPHRQLLVQLLDDVFAWFAALAIGMAEATFAYSVLNIENQVVARARSNAHGYSV